MLPEHEECSPDVHVILQGWEQLKGYNQEDAGDGTSQALCFVLVGLEED